jgi:hypothetical protein
LRHAFGEPVIVREADTYLHRGASIGDFKIRVIDNDLYLNNVSSPSPTFTLCRPQSQTAQMTETDVIDCEKAIPTLANPAVVENTSSDNEAETEATPAPVQTQSSFTSKLGKSEFDPGISTSGSVLF